MPLIPKLQTPTQAQEGMEKIKQKLIRATVSMPIAPVVVFQSVVDDQVLIYSVGGGLQTGMYSAQGLVCHASKMDGKSGKEWFVCKCAHILGVTTMFGSVCNFFCVAILEHGREYTYDKNTIMEIFATVVTAVSAMRTIYRDLALLWHLLQAGDLMDSFGNERAVIWLTLLPTGTKTNVTLHIKAPDDAITMNAKEIADDTDVVCYVGVVLATSAGNNTDNRLCLIALAGWSGGIWAGHLRVFTDQTAYLVYNLCRVVAETLLKANNTSRSTDTLRVYDLALLLARIEPGMLHAIPPLAVIFMSGAEALPEWAIAGFYGSVGTGGSNFAGQTLEQGAQPHHGRRRLAHAHVTTVEYRAFHPATDAAGQHVTFRAVSNSAAGSGQWCVAAALRRGMTISDGDNSKCTHRSADICLVPIHGKPVGRLAYIDGLALSTSEINHMWTDTDPSPTSDSALGPLSAPPIEGVSTVTPVIVAISGLTTAGHDSSPRTVPKADPRSDAPVLIVSGAARRAGCVLRTAGRGLAAREDKPELLPAKFVRLAPGTARDLSPGSGMRADRFPPVKRTHSFPNVGSTALAAASLTGPADRAVCSAKRMGATVSTGIAAPTVRKQRPFSEFSCSWLFATSPTWEPPLGTAGAMKTPSKFPVMTFVAGGDHVSPYIPGILGAASTPSAQANVSAAPQSHSFASLSVAQAAAERLRSDRWSCPKPRRAVARSTYAANAVEASVPAPSVGPTESLSRASDNATEPVLPVIATIRFTPLRLSTPPESVLQALVASVLLTCVVSTLSLCPYLARLAMLCSLLILVSLTVLPGLYRAWCGTLGLTDRCGESHGPPPVRRDGLMWPAFELRCPPRVIFSDDANNGLVEVKVITAQLHF
jgi:hypothetical protein